MINQEVLEFLQRIDRGYEPSNKERSQLANIEKLKWQDVNNIPKCISLLTGLIELDVSGYKLHSSQLIQLPESIGSLKNLQTLVLDKTQVSELPKSIGNLKNLQTLKLSFTHIEELPESIGNVKNLQILDLTNTQVKELERIGSLKNLQSLSLAFTQVKKQELERIGGLENLQHLDLMEINIEELPKSIENLKKLQCLNLADTQVKEQELERIGSLKNLQILYLDGTQIKEIESIGSLKNLQYLNLANTQVKKLPESIGSLKNLQYLDLIETEIKELPESIGSLKKLQTLKLGFTYIEELPKSIGSLKNLQYLDLIETEIKELPENIGSLKNLQYLDLTSTQVKELPESIGNLCMLEDLYLGYTQICKFPNITKEQNQLKKIVLNGLTLFEIPKSCLQLRLNFYNEEDYLTNIDGIFIHDLRLQKQPVSLFYQPRDLIEKYFDCEKEALKESKVIFMGDGGAGKSNTIQRIKNKGELLEKDTDVTHDIAIEHWDNSEQIVDYDGSIDFWDFGGQDIYLSMHRCFLTERSCYVIVLSNRQYGSQRGLMRQARYWLKSISAFAKYSPILIAINTWSGQPRDGISLTQLKDEFPELNIADQIVYNAHDEDKNEFNRLTTRICKMAQENFSYDLQFPTSWLNIRKRLLNEYRNENLIPEKEYYRICEEEMMQNDGYYNEDIARWLLHWFNDLGYCFNYHDIDNDEEDEEYNVLNPEWVIRAMYKIINYKISRHSDTTTPAVNEMAQELQESKRYSEGRVSKEEIIDLLKEDTGSGESYKEEEAKYIIRILTKFKLAYLIDDDETEDLFIPALCSDLRRDDFDNVDSKLCLKTEYLVRFKYLPETVIQHLMIKCYESGRRLYKVWKNGLHLKVKQGVVIVEMLDDTEIKIRYYEPENSNDCYGLHEMRTWLTEIYKGLGIENVRDYVIRENEEPHQTAFISVKALVDAYKKNPSMEEFYAQDDDVYQGYSVDEILSGLYGSNYRMLLIDKSKGKDNSYMTAREISPESLSAEYVTKQQLEKVVATLKEFLTTINTQNIAEIKKEAQGINRTIKEYSAINISEIAQLREIMDEVNKALKEGDVRKLIESTDRINTLIQALQYAAGFGAYMSRFL